jgi:hypothetical protein
MGPYGPADVHEHVSVAMLCSVLTGAVIITARRWEACRLDDVGSLDPAVLTQTLTTV